MQSHRAQGGRDVEHHAQTASPEVLLGRLEAVHPAGQGWRARCPSCGGRSRKLSIAVADDRVLLHDFGGCRPEEVLAAVGLTWADVMPPRTWPQSSEERRRARRAIREASWGAALAELAREATVVLLAAQQIADGAALNPIDRERLALAVKRIDGAARIFVDGTAWRPEVQR